VDTPSELRLSASIGCAVIDGETSDEEAILAAADRAMYADKNGAGQLAARQASSG
jgi:GGDEF domain-containing protein